MLGKAQSQTASRPSGNGGGRAYTYHIEKSETHLYISVQREQQPHPCDPPPPQGPLQGFIPRIQTRPSGSAPPHFWCFWSTYWRSSAARP